MIRALFIVHGLLFVLFIAWLVLIPVDIEKYVSPANQTKASTPIKPLDYPIDHLMVADMHADTLLWQRDFSQPSEVGHADLQRLQQVNVGLQVFMSVIEAPDDTDSDAIEQTGDQITGIALLDGWPVNSIRSYKQRALFQAERLHQAEQNSDGALKIVRYREELTDGLPLWQPKDGTLHAILGLEGAHASEFDVNNLQELYDAGFRSMELAHYSDTELAGSSSGMEKHGLTNKGKSLLDEMQRLGMILDLAHLSNQGIRDVLATSDIAVYSSHTGVTGTCPKARNLPDELIKAIAIRKGVIGIGFFDGAICQLSLPALVNAIKHVRDLVGSEYVALGSGWDIAPLAITPAQLPQLAQALIDQGFSEEEVRNVMGLNVARFFRNHLPSIHSAKK